MQSSRRTLLAGAARTACAGWVSMVRPRSWAAVGRPAGLEGNRVSRQEPLIERAIPRTGERVPVIGMGTWQTFDVGPDVGARARLAEVLGAFADGGGTVVDSSPMYGSSEAVYGDLTTRLGMGERMFVATKVWTTGRDAGIRQMEESMRRMRVQRVDLMQVHNLVDVATHLRTLREWREAGRIRYVGITHYADGAHDQVMRWLRSEPVDFVQINYSVGEPAAERALLPLAMERGVAVLVNRPFGGGELFRRVRARPVPAWVRDRGAMSWAQLFLKFVVSHPAVTAAIPATSRAAHMEDNLGAGRGWLPDEAERRRIATALS